MLTVPGVSSYSKNSCHYKFEYPGEWPDHPLTITSPWCNLKGSQSNNSPSGVGTTALFNLRGVNYLLCMKISLKRHRYSVFDVILYFFCFLNQMEPFWGCLWIFRKGVVFLHLKTNDAILIWNKLGKGITYLRRLKTKFVARWVTYWPSFWG